MMVRYLKRLKSSRLGRVQAFPMYGGLGMSAPSLHRESTDSLILSPPDLERYCGGMYQEICSSAVGGFSNL